MQTEALITGNYYHLFNRGINGEDLFKEQKNYFYFLKQYEHYCSGVFETYAYALLKNHFHILVYVKECAPVRRNDGKGFYQPDASKQLSHFFNSYTQSINKSYNRTGPLFESPFERKCIDDDKYLTSVIYYCHFNPQTHGFVNNFKDWEFTSYDSLLNNHQGFLATEKVINWFGGISQFEQAHTNTDTLKINGVF